VHSVTQGELEARLAELRRSFDGSFASAHASAEGEQEDLLAIRIDSMRRASIRLRETASLHLCPKLAWVPSTAPALIGVAAIRGAVLPAYDMRALLGHGPSTSPRWLVVPAAAPLALLFESFESMIRVPAGTATDVIDLPQLCAEISRAIRRGP
jgi:chemotaxis signal transduction protein